ncbi:MAG TPA: GC-type dockerin domain-anchored protein [Phycisphaerales bacterium]|nr:GC-type dockerin domain-anchored protein [Phycisphaerales bacterium]
MVVACGLSCARAAQGALPPFSLTQVYSQNTFIQGSSITFAFNSGLYSGPGFLGMAIGNGGLSYVHVALFADPPPPLPPAAIFRNSNHAVLSTGLSGINTTPFLFGGAGYDAFSTGPGSVFAPSTDYIFDEAFWTSANNNGVCAVSLRLGPTETNLVLPVTGVYVSDGIGGAFAAMPVKEGDAVTAPGLAPGTVFAAFGPDRIARYQNNAPLTGMVQITDNNLLLVAGNIIENGVTKRAILRVALGATGAVLSESLVAKEGGPVGTGSDTWTTLATLPNTCAINSAGQVIYSGTTAGGVDGIFVTTAGGAGGSFVATKNGPAPLGGQWGQLSGAPVDINRSGHFVFRGVPLGDGQWTEVADAPEVFSNGLGFAGTAGGGPLTRISGALSNDFDVDVYYIAVGDPALSTQTPFSATTVPDPGSGFAGAAFDSVLYLFSDAPNCNGATRVAIGRNDDAAPGVIQSALTTASLRSSHTPGTKYFLAVSTPRARPIGASGDVWAATPERLALAGGIVYWMDPGLGQIGRADAASGALLAPIAVGVVPQGGPGSPTSPPYLDTSLVVHDAGAGSRILFYQKGTPTTFRSCHLDGSGLADVTLSSLSAAGTTAMAVDSVHARMYWATLANPWRINSCDIDGANAQTIYTGTGFQSVTALAVDPSGAGKVYWFSATNNEIGRANLDGSSPEVVLAAAGARSLSIDPVAQRLYYTSSVGNKIGVIDTPSLTALGDLVSTPSPSGVALDSAAGRLYWSSPYERMVRRTLIASPSVENWLSIGPDLGERLSDGPANVDCAGVSGFARSGTAGSVSLPYQIKLTGATFASQAAMLCRDNTQKVVSGGDTLPGTGGAPLTVVGAPEGPVRISDRGVVAWRGRWVSGGTRTGIFMNTDKVFDDTSTAFGGAETGVGNMDMSASGQYLVTSTFNGSFTTPGGYLVRVAFDSVPGCAADYNLSGSLEVQDIFDFLNGWFAGNPAADFNENGQLQVQDIFDFLNAWFAGC